MLAGRVLAGVEGAGALVLHSDKDSVIALFGYTAYTLDGVTDPSKRAVTFAYNGGPGPVYAAIKKSGSRNFYNLQYFLPAESREHVKKYIATHYYFEGRPGITTLTKIETYHYAKAMAQMAKSNELTKL